MQDQELEFESTVSHVTFRGSRKTQQVASVVNGSPVRNSHRISVQTIGFLYDIPKVSDIFTNRSI